MRKQNGIYWVANFGFAKYEFYEYIANVIQTAEQRVDIWRRSSSRTVQYLLHLYSDPDYLEKVLSSKGSWRLYTTDGGFFYMASEGEIESHRPSEDNANEETIGLERLFGDSWFSEKAHTDMKVLKKEFRELAKKYHPDVSTDLLKCKLPIFSRRFPQNTTCCDGVKKTLHSKPQNRPPEC